MAGTLGERATRAGRRAYRVSASGLVAALTVATACILSTSSASAAGLQTTVSPPSAVPGSVITVSLSDRISPDTPVQVTITGPLSSEARPVDTVTGAADGAGAYSQAIPLPASLSPGLYTVVTCAYHRSVAAAALVGSCLAPATLQVVLPTRAPQPPASPAVRSHPRLSVTPDQAQPGATIELSGSGWDPRRGSVRVFLSRAASVDGAAALVTIQVGPRGRFRSPAQVGLTTPDDTYTLYACQRCHAIGPPTATAPFVVLPLRVPSGPSPSGPTAQSLGPTASTDDIPPPGEAAAGFLLVALLVLGAWRLGSTQHGHRRTRTPSPHDMRLVGYPGPLVEVSVSRPGPQPALAVRLVPHPDCTDIRDLVEVRS